MNFLISLGSGYAFGIGLILAVATMTKLFGLALH